MLDLVIYWLMIIVLAIIVSVLPFAVAFMVKLIIDYLRE